MKSGLFWRINQSIPAASLRVISADGKQIGILTKEEALAKAKVAGMTLVEIAPNAKPPVAKIVDFGKFRYQEEKKIRREHAHAKGGELKEVRFSPFIAENDYQTRLGRVKEFIAAKDKVRLVVVFRLPQMRSRNFGYKLLERIVADFGGEVAADGTPKFFGRHLIMVISPTTKSKRVQE